MENKKHVSEKINVLIVKNTDLHHLYLSLVEATEADFLKGKLKSHADKHRLMNLELVGELKAYHPEASIDMEGSLSGGLSKGWEEVKKSFNLESDESILETFNNSHQEATLLYEKQLNSSTFEFIPLQKVLKNHLEWFKSVEY